MKHYFPLILLVISLFGCLGYAEVPFTNVFRTLSIDESVHKVPTSFSATAEVPFTNAFRTVSIDASVHNVPTSFSATNVASRILSGLNGYSHIAIVRNNTCALVLNSNYDSPAPANSNDSNLEIPTTLIGFVFDNVSIAGSVYLRSEGSACTSGKINVWVW